MVGSISGSSYQTSMLSQLTQKLFSMMDEDGSGSVSKTELQSASGQESSAIDAFFSQTDSDSSDAITQQEFASALSQLFQEMKSGSSEGMSNDGAPPPPPPSQDSSGMFSSLDTDSDGYLTVDEMTAGGVPDAEKIFSEIDTDGDGKVSQTESDAFDEKMKANGPQGMAGAPPPPPSQDSGGMFNSLDTDSDGKVSQTESDAFDEKMKANGPQSASSESESNSAVSLQAEFLNKLIEMISQNKGYADATSNTTSIFA